MYVSFFLIAVNFFSVAFFQIRNISLHLNINLDLVQIEVKCKKGRMHENVYEVLYKNCQTASCDSSTTGFVAQGAVVQSLFSWKS